MRGASALACAALAAATGAHAQVSGSVALVSDYRFRGLSLSERRPAAQLTLSWEHTSGAYAGVFGSTVRLAASNGVQTLGYVGYSARLAGSLSWDIGTTRVDFSKPRGYAYTEVYVGMADTDWSARISRTPRYFGTAASAVYAELNLTPGSERDLVPLLHLGVLHTSVPPYPGGPRSRWDARIGLAWNRGLSTVQLSWGTTSHAGGLAEGRQDKSAWVLRLTRWL